MTATVSSVGMRVSADNVYSPGIGSFDWSIQSAKTVNKSNTSRYVIANFRVYEANTGKYITSSFNSNTGGYDTAAVASNPGYSSTKYHFICSGAVYNGSGPNTGTAWTTGDKPCG